jgi:hypothetical protein
MKNVFGTVGWFICALTLNRYCADLFTSDQVQQFLASNANAPVAATGIASVSVSGVQTVAPSSVRPMIYRVTKAAFSRDRLAALAAAVNLSAGGAAATQGNVTFISDRSGAARVGYDAARGSYFFHNNSMEQKPLSKTDPALLESLKTKAQKLLVSVLPDLAQNFVFANTETDSVASRAGDSPVLLRQTLRYTRNIDARHIVDNTAYFKATFAGNQDLCRFELVNPQLDALPLQTMVRPSATGDRLKAWTQEKTTALSSTGEAVGVRAVLATKALNTYRSMSEGADTYLVPHVSFWSTLKLENGISYDRFIDFCMDAKRTPNLDSSMIENNGR